MTPEDQQTKAVSRRPALVLFAQAREVTPSHISRAVRHYRAHEAELRKLRLSLRLPLRSEATRQWYELYDGLSRASPLLAGIQMGVDTMPATFIAHVVEMVAVATTLKGQLSPEQYGALMASWEAGFAAEE
ncbi:hypothetical protein Dxin01_00785 [Deinococcus xinjiangensis]|uniref:Uncharacterized protein n=1 Tax=Deinococcus xinjiangensis TaxID=457454 RepID=A0ABP9V716_9DEIO